MLGCWAGVEDSWVYFSEIGFFYMLNGRVNIMSSMLSSSGV